jgi:hypothetical protein
VRGSSPPRAPLGYFYKVICKEKEEEKSELC